MRGHGMTWLGFACGFDLRSQDAARTGGTSLQARCCKRITESVDVAKAVEQMASGDAGGIARD